MKTNNMFNPYTEEPNLFLKNTSPDKSSRKAISLQIIPASWVRFSFLIFVVLLATPITTAMFYGRNPDHQGLYTLLLGSCFFLSLYSSLLGFIYINFKIPYLQDIKNRLGYKED